MSVSLNGISNFTSNIITTRLASKQDVITLTGDKIVVTDATGKLTTTSTAVSKLDYLTNVTSDIQSQITSVTESASSAAIAAAAASSSSSVSPTLLINDGLDILLNTTEEVFKTQYELIKKKNNDVKIYPDYTLNTPYVSYTDLKTGIVQVACGGTNTMFLENTGNVYSALATPTYVLKGSQPNNTTANLANIVQVACGGGHTIFLENTGNVYGAGLNTSYQLGNGSLTAAPTPTYVLKGGQPNNTTANLANIVQVGCGTSYTIFLENTGNVYGTGENGSYQLGNGAAGAMPTPTYVKKGSQENNPTANLANIVQVACGDIHTMYLENTGNVYGAGNNASRQLGNGSAATAQTPTYVLKGSQPNNTTANLANIVQVACGSSYTIFLENTGNVYGTGANTSRQLGIGTTSTAQTPTYVLKGYHPIGSGGARINTWRMCYRVITEGYRESQYSTPCD